MMSSLSLFRLFQRSMCMRSKQKIVLNSSSLTIVAVDKRKHGSQRRCLRFRSISNYISSRKELFTAILLFVVAIQLLTKAEATQHSIHNIGVRSQERWRNEQRDTQLNPSRFALLHHFKRTKISSVFQWSRADQEIVFSDAPTAITGVDSAEPTISPTGLLPSAEPIPDIIASTSIPVSDDFLTEQPTASSPGDEGKKSEKPNVLSPSATRPPVISFLPSMEPTPKYEYSMTTLLEPKVSMEFTLANRRLQSTNYTLSKYCTKQWRAYVRDRIEEQANEVIPIYETLNVGIVNISMAKSSNVLAFTFDVLIEIRSAVTSHDVDRYILGPFDAQAEKDELIKYLKDSECKDFVSIRSVAITVPTSRDANGVGEEKIQSKQSSKVGLIAGLGVAIAAILMFTLSFFIVKTRRRRLPLEDDDDDGPIFDLATLSERDKDHEYVSEIGINANQDVSTLGDPVFPEAARNGDDLSTIESMGHEYDYQQAYQDVRSSAGSSELAGTLNTRQDNDIETVYDSREANSGKEICDSRYCIGKSILKGRSVRNEILRKKAVVEESFEVLAPAGVLGLTIESSKEGGFPVVHSLKRDSVLAGVVQEGDRILSIDGEDVLSLKANDTSALIASKKAQPFRKFVFSRSTMKS